MMTAEQCLAALKRVAESTTGSLTVQRYEDSKLPGEPNAAHVQKLCGSWLRALHLLGLDDRMSAKGRGRIARGEVLLD